MSVFGRRSPFGSLAESIVEQSSDCGTALWLGAYRLSEIREAGNSKVDRPQTRPYIALRGHGKAAVEAELEKIEAKEKRIKTLRQEAVAWHRADRLRQYVTAACESGRSMRSGSHGLSAMAAMPKTRQILPECRATRTERPRSHGYLAG
jgi:hypothetical protein